MRREEFAVIETLKELKCESLIFNTEFQNIIISESCSEAIVSLVEANSAFFKVLVNSKYTNKDKVLDVLLKPKILERVVAKNPPDIREIPDEYITKRLLTVAEEHIDVLSPATKEYFIKSLNILKSKLLGQEETTTETTPESAINTTVLPQQEEGTMNQPEEENKTTTTTASVEETENTTIEETTTTTSTEENDNTSVEETTTTVETVEKEKVSEEPIVTTKEDNNDTIVHTSLSTVTNTSINSNIQSAYIDAFLKNFTSSLKKDMEDSVSNIAKEAITTNTQALETILATITTNLQYYKDTLDLLETSLNDPAKSLLTNFNQESERITTTLSNYQSSLEKQHATFQELTTNFNKQFTDDLYPKIEKLVADEIKRMMDDKQNGITKRIDEVAISATRSIQKSTESVEKSAFNSIETIKTMYGDHKDIFNKTYLLKHITFAAVFINAIGMLVILIILISLLRG